MSCRLKHLAVAAAIIGLATQTWADSGYFPGSTDLQGATPLADGLWTAVGDAEVITDATVTGVIQAANKPSDFASTRTSVLSVDNDNDAPIVRNLKSGGAAPSVTTNVYADVLIKGTPLANDADAPTAGSNDKLLVYTRVSSDALATNLCVLAKAAANSGATNEFVLTKSIGKDEWHRLVIVAKTDGTYQLYCDDLTAPCATTGNVDTFYPINAGSAMTSVAFAGTGYVDDIILSTFNPVDPVYTVTWDTSLASVKYTTDGITTNDLTVADGQYQFQSATPITIIANNGFRTFDDTYTLSTPTHALVVPAGLAYYSDGDGTEQNPYEIPTYEALVAMKDAVAGGTGNYRSAYYVQTRDIDCTGKAAFAGIGTYSSSDEGGLKAGDPRIGVPFAGTYDGQGHKISNIAFTSRSYAGVFNQVNGGTIKNLTVQNATGAKGISIVGNAGNGATLQNLVAEGTFGSSASPATHNAAGIAIRLSAGGTGTLVKDCTNNATIYGTYTKVGGICALTQTKVSGGAVTFDGCANNGDLYLNHTPSSASDLITGFAGIVGYVQDDTVLVGCSNTGTLHNTNEAANKDKDGALIGWAYGKALTDNGGNSAAKTDKMVGYQIQGVSGQSITGFKYATISGNVATTISGNPVANGTYLLEGNAAPVIELANGQTIAFDTSLSYTLTDTGITAASPLVALPSTSGNVTTYSTGYFPRTATAGQDGSAANPFELADADDIVALKAAFAADSTYRSKNYKVVADIDATDLGYWAGIGAQATANTGLSNATFDGAGHIISNLSFDNSDNTRKYRGFFNRADGSVIKDLTINVVGFKDMTDPALEHGYAAFVGNMDNTTLLRCKATGTLGTTAKPTMHTTAGLAVKVASSGTFVDCTNYVNIVCSLNDNPKVGGILGLLNGGSATVSNCWNFGSLTATPAGVVNSANGVGGLVGYTQGNLTIYGGGNEGTVEWTKTTAAATENKAISVGTIIGMETGSGKSATVSGGVVAQADAAPAGNYIAQISGLSFATVSGNVATFVPTLASNNTYKVMMDGATATYNFAAPGTIAFDTTMYTPTYAITAAEGLDLSDDTVNNVKTYTATVSAPAYPTYLADADATIKAKYDTWKVTNGTDTESAYEAAFLLNANPQNLPIGAAYLKIASITQVSGGWELEIVSDATTLTAESNSSGLVGNGYLAIVYAADLATLASGGTAVNLPVTVTDGHIKVTVTAQNAKFMKAKLSCTAEANE